MAEIVVRRRIARSVAIALLLAVSTLAPNTEPSAAVVGGTETGPYPWSVALVRRGSGDILDRLICSGSLIEPQWVLTARHCGPFDPSNVTVVIGRTPLRSGNGQTRSIAGLFIPRSQQVFPRDIMLLRLDRPSTLQDLQLAGPGDAGSWGEGSSVRLYGYGRTSTNGSPSNSLRRGSESIIHLDQDHWSFMYLDPHARVSQCRGDSGGPIITSTPNGPRQVGVISRRTLYTGPVDDPTYTCDPRYYQTGVKVGYRSTSTNSPAYRWITQTIRCGCHLS